MRLCTAVKIDYTGGVVLGRTMDYEVDVDYNILYLPRDYVFGRDLDGNPLVAKYEALGICFRNFNPLKDGVNEHGLMGVTNAFNGFNLYPNQTEPGKINLASLDYLNYALTRYASVEEVIADLPNIHFSTKNSLGEDALSPDFHHIFADPSGRCVVVEPKQKEIFWFENPYGVMTNSPGFSSHTKRLHKLIDTDHPERFSGSKGLPGGYDPVSRFIRAYYMRRMSPSAQNGEQALAQAHNILNAVALPEGFIRNRQYDDVTYTRYLCAYDGTARRLTMKSASNPAVYELSLDDITDKHRRQSWYPEKQFTGISLKQT